MQQYSQRDIDITPPCPNDLIEYVELSSSNNDDDATYILLLLSNEVMEAKRENIYSEWIGHRMKQADSTIMPAILQASSL